MPPYHLLDARRPLAGPLSPSLAEDAESRKAALISAAHGASDTSASSETDSLLSTSSCPPSDEEENSSVCSASGSSGRTSLTSSPTRYPDLTASAKKLNEGLEFTSGSMKQILFVIDETDLEREISERDLDRKSDLTRRAAGKRNLLNGDAPSATIKYGKTAVRSAQKTAAFQYNTRGNPIVIRNVIIFAILHFFAAYGVFLVYAKRLTALHIVMLIYGNLGGLGITAGAHRLWAHKSYKAKLPLRIFLMLCNCIAGQNDLHEWVRDHRVHHKFTETDADPHNSHRGYFFSHIGWLMTRKHPDVITKGKQLDMSDIEADPVIRFQKRFYIFLYFLMAFFVPAATARYSFGACWWDSVLIAVFARYCISLHCTWFVNSAAHMWGDQPYDERINPRENILVSFGALGEGFHNYHHAFPFDYKTSEMGWKVNISAMFIDAMALIGQAYDLRTLDKHYIAKRKARVAAQHAQRF